MYAQSSGTTAAGLGVIDVLRRCADDLTCADEEPLLRLRQDDLDDVLARLGEQHRPWLVALAERHVLRVEPVLGEAGEILAAPLFTFDRGGRLHACLDPQDDSPRLRAALEDAGVVVVAPE